VFAVPNAPLAQPWNCIVGNTIGAFVGVSCFKVFNHAATAFEDVMFVASACAVSWTVVVMLLTKSVHPPAGATALIAVTGGARVQELGYKYMAFPILLGSVLQVILAILLNNISTMTTRSYPTVWLPVPNPTLSAEPVAGPSEPEPVPTEDLDSNRGYVPFALESGPGAAAKVLQEDDDSVRANHAAADYKL
jgi:CBS-domain-containing membrane protein